MERFESCGEGGKGRMRGEDFLLVPVLVPVDGDGEMHCGAVWMRRMGRGEGHEGVTEAGRDGVEVGGWRVRRVEVETVGGVEWNGRFRVLLEGFFTGGERGMLVCWCVVGTGMCVLVHTLQYVLYV